MQSNQTRLIATRLVPLAMAFNIGGATLVAHLMGAIEIAPLKIPNVIASEQGKRGNQRFLATQYR